MDRGAWQAIVLGIPRVGHNLAIFYFLWNLEKSWRLRPVSYKKEEGTEKVFCAQDAQFFLYLSIIR